MYMLLSFSCARITIARVCVVAPHDLPPRRELPGDRCIHVRHQFRLQSNGLSLSGSIRPGVDFHGLGCGIGSALPCHGMQLHRFTHQQHGTAHDLRTASARPSGDGWACICSCSITVRLDSCIHTHMYTQTYQHLGKWFNVR